MIVMANRSKRAEIARATLNILSKGYYNNQIGEIISIEKPLHDAVLGSIHYKPEDFQTVYENRDEIIRNTYNQASTNFEVTNEATLSAAHRLTKKHATKDVLCLNFASAKNPGGGFLGGSQAQEESLARASGLYECIKQMKAYYEVNRAYKSSLYTDNMIYSPKVPVFRNDDDSLLDPPYLVSFLTAPAVNAGAVMQNEPENIEHIEPTMLRRIEQVLSIAVVHKYQLLVLGAWGCGVFKNDPADVAHYFKSYLEHGVFKNVFEKVVFAVLDTSDKRRFIHPFENEFG